MNLDVILDAVKQNATALVSESAKRELFLYIQNKGIGTLKDIAEGYKTALKESGTNNSGWLYIRDVVLFPIVITLGVNLLEMVIEQVAKAQGVELDKDEVTNG